MVLIFCLLIVGGAGFIGWQIKNYFASRNKFFNDALLFCENVLTETNFGKTPLRQIIEKNKKNYCKDFSKSLDEFLCCIKNGQEYVEKSNLLKEDEKNLVQNFFNSLGKSDLLSHNNLVESFKEKIKNKIDRQMDEEKKKGSAIFKVSICIGLACAILLI